MLSENGKHTTGKERKKTSANSNVNMKNLLKQTRGWKYEDAPIAKLRWTKTRKNIPPIAQNAIPPFWETKTVYAENVRAKENRKKWKCSPCGKQDLYHLLDCDNMRAYGTLCIFYLQKSRQKITLQSVSFCRVFCK